MGQILAVVPIATHHDEIHIFFLGLVYQYAIGLTREELALSLHAHFCATSPGVLQKTLIELFQSLVNEPLVQGPLFGETHRFLPRRGKGAGR